MYSQTDSIEVYDSLANTWTTLDAKLGQSGYTFAIKVKKHFGWHAGNLFAYYLLLSRNQGFLTFDVFDSNTEHDTLVGN